MRKKFGRSLFSLFVSAFFINGCALQIDDYESEKLENKTKVPIKIPLIRKINSQTDLYLLDVLSGEMNILTDDSFDEADPYLMPNGNVLFSSRKTGNWQLYTIDPDSKEIIQLTNDKAFNNYRPSLTVDGRIVFVSDRLIKPNIFSINSDGSELIKLTNGDHYYDYPAPLDDGTVLYLSNEGNKWEVWQINADGTNKQKITNIFANPVSLAAMPSYVRDTQLRTPLPDDSFAARRSYLLNKLLAKAVFTARNENGDFDLYRINVDGTDLRNLTKVSGVDANPVVMPNGKIIFTSDRDGDFDVWMMDPDGYNPINLTRDPNYASSR